MLTQVEIKHIFDLIFEVSSAKNLKELNKIETKFSPLLVLLEKEDAVFYTKTIRLIKDRASMFDNMGDFPNNYYETLESIYAFDAGQLVEEISKFSTKIAQSAKY